MKRVCFINDYVVRYGSGSLPGLKHKIRRLKRLEIKIRFQDRDKNGAALVWDSFFDLRDPPAGKAKYTLSVLASLNREALKSVIDEYFARVYFEFFNDNDISAANVYDPETLAKLDLPFYAGAGDIKKRFRELAKIYHPDAGGDTVRFVELMEVYRKLARQ